MKASSTTKQAKFKPVEITLEIESQTELDFLGSLFDHTSVHDAANNFDGVGSECCELIREALESEGADIHKVEKLRLKST